MRTGRPATGAPKTNTLPNRDVPTHPSSAQHRQKGKELEFKDVSDSELKLRASLAQLTREIDEKLYQLGIPNRESASNSSVAVSHESMHSGRSHVGSHDGRVPRRMGSRGPVQ
jgi:hypothetical protein